MPQIVYIKTDPRGVYVGAVRTEYPPMGAAYAPPAGWLVYEGPAEPGWAWDGSKAIRPDPLITALWEEADARAARGADANAREKYLWWMVDPTSSAERKRRITAVNAWADDIWQDYASASARVRAGDRAARLREPGDVPNCPWTFWDIANA